MKLFFSKNIDYNSFSDEELINQFVQKRDNEILGILYKRYAHLIYGVCFKYLKNREKAMDSVMAIFEKLLTDAISSDIKKFSAWIYTVSKNHCLMELRKEKTDERRVKIFVENNDDFMESEDDLHLYNKGDPDLASTSKLEKAIQSLNDEQRMCIDLMYLKDKSYKEIAEITGYDLLKVKSHIQNGKRNLKIKIDEN